ncbi:GntR family transcriptional regulator [Rhodococcus marinonascens]|uniref:GntR family transcriptional regulator n=1 Tax=Rhodococcus marinonascens TaxID=38311 RepID=UPI000A02BB13|nr:GntR family transcriptional regulator [Rhodococcus marinonascens]
MNSSDSLRHEAHLLATHRGRPQRTSRRVRVAGILRDAIVDGTFRPGARLPEPDICAGLDVSRNTVREAFQILIEDRLVAHELNRGVFVRVPTAEDITEVYICRRVVECSGVAGFDPETGDLSGVAEALTSADERFAAEDWAGVSTADLQFHNALASLNHSCRIDELMRSIWNETRLVFHAMDTHQFHGPYLARNHQIYDALMVGHTAVAGQLLKIALKDAEAQTLKSYQLMQSRDTAGTARGVNPDNRSRVG